ncbi:NAC domain-containing protein 14-like isoform X1 [Castanea sativa]|uniref:NAC domain-containing protein 14-like isoform X1 n=1 Tax=Castanea sativa TaxID=21020 RepID=UPI003F64A775
MTTKIKGMESMLVGFRFHPTDEELVSHYLRLKMEGNDSLVHVIPEVNVCKSEPCDLPKFSVIKSDDPEWFFFSPRDFKNSKSNRRNRATQSGYWKVTGKDRKIKARGTNNVIGTMKTLVFYGGLVRGGVRTNWVMHEYHPTVTLPHQRAFVLCRLKNKTDKKTNVTARDEGEESSYIASDFENPMPEDTIPEVHDQTQEDLESVLPLLHQPQDYDASSSQLPLYNQQEPSFVHSTFTNGCNGLQLQSDDNEHGEDQRKFVDSLFVDQDEHPYEEILHLSHTDADTAQPEVEDKDASRHNVTVDLPMEKNVTEPNKEQKMAKGTNAKEILKLTRDWSAGSDRKGNPNFQEISLLGHESSPPWAYFVNILIGILLFVVVIWGVVICGNWC